MNKLLFSMVFALLLFPMTASAVCTQSGGSIVRVTYWADSAGSTHYIYYRPSSLTNYYYYCTTTDDDFAELASNALNGPTEVNLSGTATTCPTSGSSRNMGICRWIVENP